MAFSGRQVSDWCLLFLAVTVAASNSSWQSRVLRVSDSAPRCLDEAQDGFCEQVTDYPSLAHLERILKRNASLRVFFDRLGPEPIANPVVTKTRFGPGSDRGEEERVCDVSERVIRPRAATNRNGQMRLIVNDGHKYRQFVKTESCRRPDESCSRIAGSLPRGYTSRCAQKFGSTLLVALDNHLSDEPYTDDFDFPTACVCLLRHSFFPR